MKIDNHLDWERLKLFALTVESGSMAQAARRTRMTRANVSHQLRMLEATLGVELLRRTTRQRDLTQAGQILYQHVRRMMLESVAAVTAIEELGKSVRGDVRIRLPTGLGHLYLTPLLMEFIEQHPEITLRVNINDHIGDLISAEVDVALKITSAQPGPDVVSKVCPVYWCLCASTAYFSRIRTVKRPQALADKAWVTPAALGRTFQLKLYQGDQLVTFPITARLQSGDYPFLVEAVQAGMGIALLPRYAVWKQLQSGQLVEVMPEYRPEGAGDALYVLASRGRYPSHAAQILIEFIARHLQDRMHDWGGSGYDTSALALG